MGYERYPRGGNSQSDYYGRNDPQDYGRDYGSGREFGYSSARDYEAASETGGRDYRQDRDDRSNRDYRGSGQYDRANRDSYARRDFSQAPRGRTEMPYYGSLSSDSNRFVGEGRYRQRDYGRQPQGYDYEERGFMSRAGDEVRSWFGDEDAERRREMDQRYDERSYGAQTGHPRDADYHSWRRQQIDALDRDYDEYRRENRSKFHNEFGSWRQERQGQRSALGQVVEHMEVVGSDGEHVGTVDKVRGDRIILTKSDPDAGGHHHSIPSRWIDRVDDKVTIRKTASDAQAHWKDEERNQALFNEGRDRDNYDVGAHNLDRSFSGTY